MRGVDCGGGVVQGKRLHQLERVGVGGLKVLELLC